MSDRALLDAFNSFTTYGVLFAIAVGIWVLVAIQLKNRPKKSSKG